MNNIFNNKFLCVPFCVWFAIQIVKFITDWIVNKKPNFKRPRADFPIRQS